MPEMRLVGYTPAHDLPSLRLGALHLYPLPLPCAPCPLPHFIRARFHAVALIRLPQIDALTFPAACQGGRILRRHQVKIEQQHDIANRAFHAAKVPVRLPMAHIGVGRIKAQGEPLVLTLYRTRAASQRQGQFFAQLVLQRLEIRQRVQPGLGIGPQMQASRGQRAVERQQQIRQLLFQREQLPVGQGVQRGTGKGDQPVQALTRGREAFRCAFHGVKDTLPRPPAQVAFPCMRALSPIKWMFTINSVYANNSRSDSVCF